MLVSIPTANLESKRDSFGNPEPLKSHKALGITGSMTFQRRSADLADVGVAG